MNLASAIASFARQLAANGCSVHTQRAYVRDLEALSRWLKGRVYPPRRADLQAVTPAVLAGF